MHANYKRGLHAKWLALRFRMDNFIFLQALSEAAAGRNFCQRPGAAGRIYNEECLFSRLPRALEADDLIEDRLLRSVQLAVGHVIAVAEELEALAFFGGGQRGFGVGG